MIINVILIKIITIISHVKWFKILQYILCHRRCRRIIIIYLFSPLFLHNVKITGTIIFDYKIFKLTLYNIGWFQSLFSGHGVTLLIFEWSSSFGYVIATTRLDMVGKPSISRVHEGGFLTFKWPAVYELLNIWINGLCFQDTKCELCGRLM